MIADSHGHQVVATSAGRSLKSCQNLGLAWDLIPNLASPRALLAMRLRANLVVLSA
jgi:hypothetical protein